MINRRYLEIIYESTPINKERYYYSSDFFRAVRHYALNELSDIGKLYVRNMASDSTWKYWIYITECSFVFPFWEVVLISYRDKCTDAILGGLPQKNWHKIASQAIWYECVEIKRYAKLR